MVPTVKGEKAV